jgi:hypothetical protein
VVAAQSNPDGALIVSLNAFLNAGSYIVEVGTVNDSSGTVILVAQSETPLTATALPANSLVSAEVTLETPIAVYTFTSLAEPAFLYIESGLTDRGANIRILNTATGNVSGSIASEMTGGRFRIPATNINYQIEIVHSGSGVNEPFTLCLAAVSAGGCESGTVVEPVQTQEAEVSTSACTVTPNLAGGANIRQSASAETIILGALPGGAVAEVLGISPNGSFYNIRYNDINGWVALSVVTANGDCSTVATVNPPPFIVPPTPTPIPPTPTPIPPSPTPIPPTPTPSGPCLITMTGEALVYSQPNAIPDYIYDEVQPGSQLIPTGRLSDNSFWQTNYAGAWIQTSLFGSVANVTGDCSSLPVVSP